MAGNSKRQGAIRKQKKGAQVGSGGQSKRALRGKGPTPPAEERKGHPAARRAAAAERRSSGRSSCTGRPNGSAPAAWTASPIASPSFSGSSWKRPISCCRRASPTQV